MTKNNIIKWTIITGLWAVLLIPFFVAQSMFFPFITGKNFAFRIIVEIIFALWVYSAFIDVKYRPKFSWVAISVGAFVFIMALADIFAVNPAKAIWSNFERMDGFITLLHLIMYLLVFGSVMKTEKIWLWFFRSSVIASIIMIISVIQEWTKTGTGRVSVTLGNPIYVAVYFMFNFFFALILLYKDVIVKSEGDVKPLKTIFSNWLAYAYSVAAFICAFGIWRTSTRGVILGLLGGLIVTSIIIAIFEKKNKLIKNTFAGLLVIIILLIGGFFAVKNTQFVQKNVTLKRLADISWTSVAGQGQARQYVWPMAIKGFLERPILGWGNEGFNNVFNKYYDERMYQQEQWFDRAHNTPLDVLAAGGALGLLAYFSIFIASLFVVIKKKNIFGITEVGLVIGLLAAYFMQSLFVFDNLISYIFFYAVLAYLYSKDIKDPSQTCPAVGQVKSQFKPCDIKNTFHGLGGERRAINDDIANYIVAPILILIFSAMIWYCNVKPINANKDLIRAMSALNQSPETFKALNKTPAEMSLIYFNKVFSANTFGSPEAREQIISMVPSIAASASIDAEVKQGFAELAYAEMQEQLKQNPNDARYQFFMGMFLENMSQYQVALPYLQKAVELSPKKLTMMFELSKCYSYLGQKTEALQVAKTAYDLVPDYTDAKMSYVAALIVNDQEASAKQLMGNATTSDQNITRAYLINAQAFVQKGNRNSAIAEIQKAIKINPEFKTQGDNLIKGISDGNIK